MKKQFIYFLSLFVMCLAACSNPVDLTALNLDSANINRLIPFRGELNNGVKQLYPEEPYKAFWAENWKTPEQSISWKVNTDGEDYMAEMIVSVNRMGDGEETELVLSNGTDSVICRINTTGWQRCRFPRPLHFNKGTSVLSLKIGKSGKQDDFNVYLYSLEVTGRRLMSSCGRKLHHFAVIHPGWRICLMAFSSTGIQRVCLSQESR